MELKVYDSFNESSHPSFISFVILTNISQTIVIWYFLGQFRIDHVHPFVGVTIGTARRNHRLDRFLQILFEKEINKRIFKLQPESEDSESEDSEKNKCSAETFEKLPT